MELKEQANTFKLTMKLEEGMLSIYLMDFIDWVIYSKTFSDCGQKNEAKMGLKEFYDSFALSEIKDLIKLRMYKFGEVVVHHDKYGFKIEKEGKMTAYWAKKVSGTKEYSLSDPTTLELRKERDMTQGEIQAEMMDIAQIYFAEQLDQKVSQLQVISKEARK